MKMSNKTYDVLNKIHRTTLGIITALTSIMALIGVLTEQGIAVPHIATITTVLIVAKAVLGEVLHLSSKEYWETVGKGENDGIDE